MADKENRLKRIEEVVKVRTSEGAKDISIVEVRLQPYYEMMTPEEVEADRQESIILARAEHDAGPWKGSTAIPISIDIPSRRWREAHEKKDGHEQASKK